MFHSHGYTPFECDTDENIEEYELNIRKYKIRNNGIKGGSWSATVKWGRLGIF